MVKELESVKVGGFTINRLDDQVIEVTIENHYHVDLEASKALKAKLLEMQPDYKNLCLLILPGEHSTVSQEAREYSSNSRLNCRCEAVVIKKLHQRIIVNFIINFTKRSKTKRKMKCFNDKDTAMDWIRKQQA